MMHFRKNKQERSEPADLTNADVTSADPMSEVTPDLSLDTSAQVASAIGQDWEVENSSLSAEEAEEIRAAFQQVLAMEAATSPAPLSVDEALELTIDPLDLRDYDASVDLIDSFVPEDLNAAAVTTPPVTIPPATISSVTPLVDAVVDADSPDIEIDTLTEAVATPMAAAEEPICLGFQESAQAIEQIALAVDETDLIDQPIPVEDEATIVEPNLAVEAATVVEAEVLASDWTADRDEAIAVDAIVEAGTPSLIDSISLVDMGMEAEELTTATTSDAPLTYFQYYLEDDSDDAAAAYNQPTWRQPSVPAGLIGAGVLGATLISGFMIADSLKQSSNTQAKKPNSPSPLQSLDPQGQTTAMATPKPAAPETMKPEVPLPPAPSPKTDTLVMAPVPPALPPLPTMVEPNVMALKSFESAVPTTVSSGTVADLKVGKAVAAPETLPVPPNPQIAPINSEVAVNQPRTESTVMAAVQPIEAAPRTSRGPVFEEVTPTPTVGVVPGAPTKNPRVASPSRAALPQLEPGVEGTAADLQTAARTTEMPPSESSLSATPIAPPVKGVEDQSVFVPVETAPPEITAVPPSPQELGKGTPTELIYRQEAAPAKSDPTTQSVPAQTAIDPSLQSLLSTPAPGLSATGTSLRSLTQAEATAVAQANQLGAFSRQSLGPKEYVQAYQLVSQQLNVLPPFGFIDYQRQMILLPADVAAALNQVDGSIDRPQMAQADAMTVANTAAIQF
jgi:hypothetical protein